MEEKMEDEDDDKLQSPVVMIAKRRLVETARPWSGERRLTQTYSGGLRQRGDC